MRTNEYGNFRTLEEDIVWIWKLHGLNVIEEEVRGYTWKITAKRDTPSTNSAPKGCGKMYCSVEGCGEIDEGHNAYCIKHIRSPHRICGEFKHKGKIVSFLCKECQEDTKSELSKKFMVEPLEFVRRNDGLYLFNEDGNLEKLPDDSPTKWLLRKLNKENTEDRQSEPRKTVQFSKGLPPQYAKCANCGEMMAKHDEFGYCPNIKMSRFVAQDEEESSKKQFCECNHIVDEHIEQINGKAIAGECSKCDCKRYKEQDKGEDKNGR